MDWKSTLKKNSQSSVLEHVRYKVCIMRSMFWLCRTMYISNLASLCSAVLVDFASPLISGVFSYSLWQASIIALQIHGRKILSPLGSRTVFQERTSSSTVYSLIGEAGTVPWPGTSRPRRVGCMSSTSTLSLVQTQKYGQSYTTTTTTSTPCTADPTGSMPPEVTQRSWI